MSKKGGELMEALRWLGGYIKKYTFIIILAAVLTLIHVTVIFISPYMSGFIVDDVIVNGKYALLGKYLTILLASVAVKEITWYIRQNLMEHVSQSVIKNLRCDLYEKLQRLDFKFFVETRTGDLMSRMTGDMDAVRLVMASTMANLFQMICLGAIGLATMFLASPILGLSLLAIVPFIGVFAFKYSRVSKPQFLKVREVLSRLNSVVQENISGNRAVKAFSREQFEIDKFEKVNNEYRTEQLENVAIWNKYVPLIDFAAAMTNVIFIFVGGALAIAGKISIGQFTMMNGILWCIVSPMQMIGGFANQIQQFVASSVKMRTLLDTEPAIKNEKVTVDHVKLKGKVTFKNVIFSYDDERVLKYVNFVANPGDTIGIIGPTGSGKSSLVNLISRFYDPDNGAVYIDDINVKNIDVTTIRQNVSMAMQDIFLFSDTIEANIAYGVPDATHEDVVRVAKAADAHEFIIKMPEGYDTIVGERGVGLSGGQKQRIALARALLKDPAILILDDTTSAVDMETEYSIQETLKKSYSNKTTFIIAHRISSVKNADLILVLSKGRVIEWGTHDVLLSKKGYYYEVYENQFGDFNNAPDFEIDNYYEDEQFLERQVYRNGKK